MRTLRVTAIVLFVISILFSVWANYRYYTGVNTDFPTLLSTEDVLQISVNDPPETIFRGLQANDATDGDLSSQIMVASVSHFLEPGTVRVKYVVFDSHNNSATLTRRVHYTDYTGPVFSLEKAPVYTVGSSFDLLEHIKVTDCLDGDISDQIRVISNMVNNFTPGNYPVVLEVSNSCGDTAQITLWVHYVSKEHTATVKLKEHIVYIQQGETFEPSAHLDTVTDRNGKALRAENVDFLGNLDMETPGCYQLVYSYDDGKLTGQSPLTVVVTEKEA